MTGFSMLLLGLGLGLRHATDADHVVVISTLLEREPRRLDAARIAALWGIGHTAAFLAVGVLVVLLGLRLPAEFDSYATLLLGAMLVGLGAWHLRRSLVPRTDLPSAPNSTPPPAPTPASNSAPASARNSTPPPASNSAPTPAPERPTSARPIAIGLVHGLAGSAGIAILTATTIDSRLLATLYLALFGLGTVIGMVVLTTALAWPMAWTMRKGANAARFLRGGAALLSVGLGLFVAADALIK